MQKLTAQETFDTVARHLLTQRMRSGTFGACLYRGRDGRKCAAGCLLPDEEYHPSMEGYGVLTNRNDPEAKRVREFFTERVEDLILLGTLQGLHDRDPPDEWADHLKSVACRFSLSPAVLSGFPNYPNPEPAPSP